MLRSSEVMRIMEFCTEIYTRLTSATSSFCLRKRMAAYSTRAPNTKSMQANIHASMAVSPEIREGEHQRISRISKNFQEITKLGDKLAGSIEEFERVERVWRLPISVINVGPHISQIHDLSDVINSSSH